MTIFNAKEEELINIEMVIGQIKNLQKRKGKISFKISEAIIDANKLLKDIHPVARLMGWYRDWISLVFYYIDY